MEKNKTLKLNSKETHDLMISSNREIVVTRNGVDFLVKGNFGEDKKLSLQVTCLSKDKNNQKIKFDSVCLDTITLFKMTLTELKKYLENKVKETKKNEK